MSGDHETMYLTATAQMSGYERKHGPGREQPSQTDTLWRDLSVRLRGTDGGAKLRVLEGARTLFHHRHGGGSAAKGLSLKSRCPRASWLV